MSDEMTAERLAEIEIMAARRCVFGPDETAALCEALREAWAAAAGQAALLDDTVTQRDHFAGRVEKAEQIAAAERALRKATDTLRTRPFAPEWREAEHCKAALSALGVEP